MPFGSPPTPDQSEGSPEGESKSETETGASEKPPSEFEAIQREFQEIEEKLTSEAFDIPAEDRVKIVHRILEHSLDDGLRLAKRLGVSKENIRKGLLRPSFAIKHQELIQQLSEYLDASEESNYVYESNVEIVDEF